MNKPDYVCVGGNCAVSYLPGYILIRYVSLKNRYLNPISCGCHRTDTSSGSQDCEITYGLVRISNGVPSMVNFFKVNA
jgi:hypothetical protein